MLKHSTKRNGCFIGQNIEREGRSRRKRESWNNCTCSSWQEAKH